MQAASQGFQPIHCPPSRERAEILSCFLREVASAEGFHESEINSASHLLFFHGLGLRLPEDSLVAVRLGCTFGGFPQFLQEFVGYRMAILPDKGNEVTIDIYQIRDREQFRQFFVELGESVRARTPGTTIEAALIAFLEQSGCSWDYSSFALGIEGN